MKNAKSLYLMGISFLGLLACLTGMSHAEGDMELKPISFGNYTTFGVLNGTPDRNAHTLNAAGPVENQPFSRIAVWLTQEATIDEALLVSVGVGGMFWYSLPEQEGLPHTRLIKFGPGVHVAAATYNFGDMESPWLRLKMGYFPHKYNSDAKNLGEYLFRSGTYPGTIFTGGWGIVNSAGYGANGLLGAFSFLEDRLKLDVGVFMERDLEPNFDLSPNIVASYDFGGILEVGAGVVFSHLVPFVPDKTTPKKRANAYTSHAAFADTATGKALPLPQNQHNLPGLNDPVLQPGGDPLATAVVPVGHELVGQSLPPNHSSRNKLERAGANPQYFADTLSGTNANGLPERFLDYYTFQGQKVMARAAFRPQNLLELDMLGPEDLTIYGEVALLGVKNYPFYYENMMERMPVMFGINLPTFKLLDALALEFEYHKMRFRNDIWVVLENALPVWNLDPVRFNPREWLALERGLGDQEKVEAFRELHGDPDLWWSLYAKKTVVPGLRVYLQVAKDHFRAIDYTASPTDEPLFHRKGLFEDWYWALKLEFGS